MATGCPTIPITSTSLAPSPTIITRSSGTPYSAATVRTAAALLNPARVMLTNVVFGITRAGLSKAEAVRTVAAEYDVPLERVMMVGDGANDVEAMGIVGHPVAMGNADPEVSVLARHHVPHVDRGGLPEALDLAARL